MPSLLTTIGYTALFFYIVFLLYILAMGIYRAWLTKRMPKWLLCLLSPVVLFLLAVDVVGNIVVGTIMFVDLPREWLYTRRLIRYKKSAVTWGWWRWVTASWICDHALDVFDPTGDHC